VTSVLFGESEAKAIKREDAATDKAAAAKRKKLGGRKKGALNKRTLEKIAQAEREVAAGVRGTKFAIDHMDDMIVYFRNLIASLQPWNADGSKRDGRDDKIWFRAIDAFQGFLNMRAPYQSPRLSAVQIVPSQAQQRTTVNVTILNERGEKVYSDVPEDSDMKLIEQSPHDDDEEAA